MDTPAFAVSGGASSSRLRTIKLDCVCGQRSKLDDVTNRRGNAALSLGPKTRALRPLVTPIANAAVQRTGAGKIKVIPDKDVSVGDVFYIEYEPPAGRFNLDSADVLYWAGGFKNWTGDSADETLLFPLVKLGPGRFRVSICVPDYAESVNFGFCDTDGFSWDMLYSLPVKYRKRAREDGTVEEFEADIGRAEAEDESEGEYDTDLTRESASPPVLSVEAEENLHRMRGEAQIIGEESGIGSVFISQVRDTFARFDEDRTGLIKKSLIGTLLSTLNFDLDDERVVELTAEYVGSSEMCTMAEFMSLYCHLESNDEGLDIV
jgi:hypothetical protein